LSPFQSVESEPVSLKANRMSGFSHTLRINPDPRSITNLVEVPSRRSTLWPRILFATPLTGPRRGPPSESANVHFSPGEAAARPLLGCMSGPLQGPGDPVGLMDSSAQKDQRACAPFSTFVFGPDAAGPYQAISESSRGSEAGVSRVAISLRRDERKACAGTKDFRNSCTAQSAGLPAHLAEQDGYFASLARR
jgi:hypothetical protein